MERMKADSSDELSKVRALGAINFKVGWEEVLELRMRSTRQIAKLMKSFLNN